MHYIFNMVKISSLTQRFFEVKYGKLTPGVIWTILQSS